MIIYIEGGGDSSKLRSECEKGFSKFFEAAGLKGRMPRLSACGSRNEAYAKFQIAIKLGKEAVLLVDSEAPIDLDPTTGKPVNPWIHLKRRDNWDRPDGATDQAVQFMVECMESWFVADRDQFIAYYSKDNRRCHATAVPVMANVESVAKKLVYEYLEAASLPSGPRIKYSKGSRSFEILSMIRPDVVASKSRHARRLFCQLGVGQSWLDCTEFKETPASC